MHTTVILLGLLVGGLSAVVASDSPSLSAVFDLFSETLLRVLSTPISLDDEKAKFSLEIMLANDVFTLDDALRLFIQQFLLALYNGRYHLLPEDWQSQYPAFGKIIDEINNALDLIGERTLSKISMKDIRPLVATLTPTAFADLQRLLKTMEDKAKEGQESTKEDL